MQLIHAEMAGLVSSAALAIMPPTAIPEVLAKVQTQLDGADAFMQCSYIFDAIGNEPFALTMQRKALDRRRYFRIVAPPQPSIRLLALMGPGGRMVNAPVDFVVHGSDIRLDLLFVIPGEPLPTIVPDHDVAILAYSDAEDDQSLLPIFDHLASDWPRPLLNRPDRMRRCARDALYRNLADIPGLAVPGTVRALREDLRASFPLPLPATIRPAGAHAGAGLAKISHLAEVAAYLETNREATFFVSEYVDYRSDDGRFRKFRVALIDGVPYLCHLAIADDWIVHYKTAGMDQADWKREEEERTMKCFDESFVRRHRNAFSSIAARLGLEYVVLDCAELPDGRLLLFEADTGAWIHATDPVDLFPYKSRTMRAAFSAFRNMLFAYHRRCST